MPSPRFEVPAGAVDGVNAVFTVSMPYSPGSTAVFVNGLLQAKAQEDGWIETDADNGTITMKVAPQMLDVVQVFFLDRSAPLPETQLFKITGKIRSSKSMRTTLGATRPIVGRISPMPSVHSILNPRKDLRGFVKSSLRIKATLKESV